MVDRALGLIQFKTNEDLIAEEEEAARLEAEARQRRPEILSLVQYARKCWEAAKYAKQPIETRMLKALRMRKGEHEPEKLAQIREFGGTEIYMMIPDEKCTALEAWLEDIIFVPGQEPWSTDTTPEPELSPTMRANIENRVRMEAAQAVNAGYQVTQAEIYERLQELAQQVKERSAELARKSEARAELKIKDALVEAGWKKAIKKAIPDLATFPAAFLAGPLYRNKPTIVWGKDGRPTVEKKVVREFEWVSAFDIYPSPNSTDIDSGWLFRRHRLTRAYLYSLIGVEGFDDDAINMVLQEHGQGGLTDWLAISGDYERRRLENRDKDVWDPDSNIDALQFWTSVQGLMLLQAGMNPDKIPDPLADYPVEMWLIGNYVIKCELNGDPLARKPIFKASFRDVPGSFWGQSPCDVTADKVDACNAAARSLINNMAIASGPQVGVDASMNPGGHDYTKIYPWKVWQFDMTESVTARPPMWFFQPNALTAELWNVYEKFSQQIDYILGIPKLASGGNERGGMAGTATGASMLQTNTTKVIKRVVSNIDEGWIEPSVKRTFEDMMLFERIPELLQGDIRLVASGATSMVAKEQNQVRRNEFLNLLLALPPHVAQLIGPMPIIDLIRSIAMGVDVDLTNSLPTKEKIMQQSQMMLAAQNNMQAGGGPPAITRGAPVNGAGDRVAGQDVRTF